MRKLLSAVSALAIGAGSSATIAQSGDETEKFNRALPVTDCVSQPSGDQPYPFSVARIRNVLKGSPGNSQHVDVLIVDNNFYGYRINNNPSGGPSRISSRNFPYGFFKVAADNDFSPFIGDDNPDTALPPDPDPETGHGTHVAGIVLGGMYDDNHPPDLDTNLKEPSARSLLLDDKGAPWLRISFLTIQYGSGAIADDPVGRLNNVSQLIDHRAIVNMSLGKALSQADNEPALQVPGPLIIAAAGNSGRRLSRAQGGLNAIPATLHDDGRIIVVASHDANGRISKFSNYGQYVNIAAPGCQIKSWVDGEDAAVPLSGTSMATAIVTFAAALVRSRWQPDQNDAVAIRNRLLVSARLEPNLLKCAILTDQERADPGNYCVKDGAMLDIEAAVAVTRDVIEYQDCDVASNACQTKVALGDLTGLPEAITSCVAEYIPSKLFDHGLSINGAIKRLSAAEFLVQYESGAHIGDNPLDSKTCSVPANSAAGIMFRVHGRQPDGTDVAQPVERTVSLNSLRRLVTRVSRPPD